MDAIININYKYCMKISFHSIFIRERRRTDGNKAKGILSFNRRLGRLAVESVIDSIGRYNKSDQAAYMKACIYNAPLKSSAAIASQIIEYKYEHLGNGAE